MPDPNPYGPPEQLPPPPPPQWQPPGPKVAASPLDAIIPTNPLAAISCYAGIFSIICCFFGVLLGPLAIGTGLYELKRVDRPTSHESSYGATTSKIRIWIGIVTGSIGTLVSLVVIVATILSVINDNR